MNDILAGLLCCDVETNEAKEQKLAFNPGRLGGAAVFVAVGGLLGAFVL